MKVPSTSLDPILSGESIRVPSPLPTSLQQLLGQMPLPPGTSILYSPLLLRPGMRHSATCEVADNTLDLQEAPAFPEGSCVAAAPAPPEGSRSVNLLWAELLPLCRHRPCPGPSTLRKCRKGFCLRMKRAGKVLASLEPSVLKAPAGNSQKDF